MKTTPTTHQPTAAEIRNKILGRAPALIEALDRLEKVAQQTWPVMILGESGTGKELAAKLVHAASGRKGPFITVNCAELATELIHSELFGHRKGAFSGAVEHHVGFFEQADGGTLFLDEVGDMPMTMQKALLGVLQTGMLRRVGDQPTRAIDVRVVAATHQDLNAMVASHAFRLDLLRRLACTTVRLPALRERGADIILLAKQILIELGLDRSISSATQKRLLAHPWPGNIRYLQCVIRTAALETDTVILPKHLEVSEPFGELIPEFPPQTRPEAVEQMCEDNATDQILSQCIEGFAEQGGASAQQIAAALGLSVPTVVRRLSVLINKGKIQRTGATRGARYWVDQLQINTRQRKFLSHLKDKQSLNRQDYVEFAQCTERTASRDLAALLAKGLIVQDGRSGRCAFFRLNLKNSTQANVEPQ